MKSTTLDRRGAWLIASSLLFLTFVAGTAGWEAIHAPTRDPATLRVAAQPANGEIVVLLDVTDPLSREQQAALVGWLREFELTRLRPQQRVTLWVLGVSEAGGLRRQFARYYPGREADPFLHNPAMSAAACDSLFTGPLRAALAAAVPVKCSPYSLLLEAVSEISGQPELDPHNGARHLVLISDLREHTPWLSFYHQVPSFAKFEHSRRFPQVQADLRDVPVEVLYLPRTAWDVCTPELRDFWRSYLTACGAPLVSFRRL
jgi:hypothetical protein